MIRSKRKSNRLCGGCGLRSVEFTSRAHRYCVTCARTRTSAENKNPIGCEKCFDLPHRREYPHCSICHEEFIALEVLNVLDFARDPEGAARIFDNGQTKVTHAKF